MKKVRTTISGVLAASVVAVGLLLPASAAQAVGAYQITQPTSAKCQSELKLYRDEGYRVYKTCYKTMGWWLAYVYSK